MMERDFASRWLGIKLESIAAGSAKLSMTVTEDMLNGHAICHGGIIFTLADTAFAYACNSRNVKTVALNCTINYVTSAKEGERLVALAKEVTLKGRTGVYDVIVETESGTAIAHFRGTSYGTSSPVVS